MFWLSTYLDVRIQNQVPTCFWCGDHSNHSIPNILSSLASVFLNKKYKRHKNAFSQKTEMSSNKGQSLVCAIIEQIKHYFKRCRSIMSNYWNLLIGIEITPSDKLLPLRNSSDYSFKQCVNLVSIFSDYWFNFIRQPYFNISYVHETRRTMHTVTNGRNIEVLVCRK